MEWRHLPTLEDMLKEGHRHVDLVRSQTTNIPYRTCIHRYRELDVKNWNDGITHECLSDGASYIASCARTMEERKGGKKRGREESHEKHTDMLNTYYACRCIEKRHNKFVNIVGYKKCRSSYTISTRARTYQTYGLIR